MKYKVSRCSRVLHSPKELQLIQYPKARYPRMITRSLFKTNAANKLYPTILTDPPTTNNLKVFKLPLTRANGCISNLWKFRHINQPKTLLSTQISTVLVTLNLVFAPRAYVKCTGGLSHFHHNLATPRKIQT